MRHPKAEDGELTPLATEITEQFKLPSNVARRAPEGAAPEVYLPRAVLKVVDGPLAGKVFHLAAEPIEIGRQGVAIALETQSVSREQAKIVFDGGRYTIRDGGGLNPTLVNGEPAIMPLPLKPGDFIRIAEHELQLALGDQPAAEAPRSMISDVPMPAPVNAAAIPEVDADLDGVSESQEVVEELEAIEQVYEVSAEDPPEAAVVVSPELAAQAAAMHGDATLDADVDEEMRQAVVGRRMPKWAKWTGLAAPMMGLAIGAVVLNGPAKPPVETQQPRAATRTAAKKVAVAAAPVAPAPPPAPPVEVIAPEDKQAQEVAASPLPSPSPELLAAAMPLPLDEPVATVENTKESRRHHRHHHSSSKSSKETTVATAEEKGAAKQRAALEKLDPNSEIRTRYNEAMNEYRAARDARADALAAATVDEATVTGAKARMEEAQRKLQALQRMMSKETATASR